ncbi:MAG: hypothetical protein LBP42_06680 [Treponema sp.]|jgi:hypothetical protein|nr:hypothetical protein [Treponema sp.]
MVVTKRCAAALFILMVLFCFVDGLSAQDSETASFQRGTIPAILLQPQRGEAPRYPRDVVIGELGPGDASEGAYLFARRLLSGLLTESRGSPPLSSLDGDFLEEIFAKLREINPRVYHLGGGREEPDGSISFLFRFIGREQGISGELYLRPSEDGRWELDDLIPEDPRDLLPGADDYHYDFSPYERFF